MMLTGTGCTDTPLGEAEVRRMVVEALNGLNLDGKRVLAIVPDLTRIAPLPRLFPLVEELVRPRAALFDYLIALGTHRPMTGEEINRMFGLTAEERANRYAHVNVYNHEWERPDTFARIGEIPAREAAELTSGRVNHPVPVSVNKMILDYDQILLLGVSLPHESAGFGGGYKYFFPGISGWDLINFFHWLGASVGTVAAIGKLDTPVRRVINRAGECIPVPILSFNSVMKGHDWVGLYIGEVIEAHRAACELSAQVHITWLDRPYRCVLSVLHPIFDELWTGAKGIYKVQPITEEGGEIILYAPGVKLISATHGKEIETIGYHIFEYFDAHLGRYDGVNRVALGHPVHVLGGGTYENGVEHRRFKITLATGIPEEVCRRVGLNYMDPALIDVADWEGREDEDILVVRNSGEQLYRLRSQR